MGTSSWVLGQGMAGEANWWWGGRLKGIAPRMAKEDTQENVEKTASGTEEEAEGAVNPLPSDCKGSEA